MKSVARLYVSCALAEDGTVALAEAQSHYITRVMRCVVGDTLRLFNGRDGEWIAEISDIQKRETLLHVRKLHAPQRNSPPMTLCFAPPRGGRIDSIIEKATELGASVLQPVAMQFSVVDKINPEKWAATVREAAEQCERMDLPEIRPMVSLATLLGGWDENVPLIYGDESGGSERFGEERGGQRPEARDQNNREISSQTLSSYRPPASGLWPPLQSWALLIGPEGGFSDEEHALLARARAARGVSLGPRILRVDTACITLMALTLQAWGDWELKPHFRKQP